MNNFPEKPKSNYRLEDLTSYLLELQGMGFNIYQVPNSTNRFEIVINESYNLKCSYGNSKSQVQLCHFENMVKFLNVTSKIQLQSVISGFIKEVLGKFPSSSLSARLSSNQPSTNYKSISNLIGSSEIIAIFDPYLENSSLSTVINICSFGNGKVGNNIRLLGSSRKARGTNPTFTQAGVFSFFTETNVTGSAKVMNSNTEHRRFILLTGKKSLILGHSLNSIHKNEAIRVESDADDLIFFNEMWVNADAL